MKRVMMLFMAAAMMFTAGCSSQEPAQQEEPQQETTEGETEPVRLAEQLKIVDGFMELPEETYNTTGEENGLVGIKCYADGTVKELIPKEENVVPVVIIESEKGDLLFMNFPHVGVGWDSLTVGDSVRVFFQYDGFSSKYEMPAGTFFRAWDANMVPLGYEEGEDSDLMSSAVLDGLLGELLAQGPEKTSEPVEPIEGDATTTEPEDTQPADSGPTMGQKNALASAKSYLGISAFSYSGLIEQLEYEGYSHEEAVYAADNCGADWNEQAKKSAKTYLSITSFSRQGLIEQLEYEGFSYEQAVYGAEANGY